MCGHHRFGVARGRDLRGSPPTIIRSDAVGTARWPALSMTSTVIFGSAMIAVGLIVAQSGGRLSLLLGYGLFVGLLGNSGINAPLYVYLTRWFDRRRGTALALLGSGSSVSAAIWAPIFMCGVSEVSGFFGSWLAMERNSSRSRMAPWSSAGACFKCVTS